MFKSTVSALVAVLVLSPAAMAEGAKMVTLTHQYDTELVSTDEGAAQLLTELNRAAKRTCTSRMPASGITYTDAACAESLFVAAVKQVQASQIEAGVAVAPAIEKVALTQIASVN